jgi:hypothetical protein
VEYNKQQTDPERAPWAVIPLANRGDNLMLRLSCTEVRVEALDIFELYEESWA